ETRILSALGWSRTVPAMDFGGAAHARRIWNTRRRPGRIRPILRQELRIGLRRLLELGVHLQRRQAVLCAEVVYLLKYGLSHVRGRVGGRTVCQRRSNNKERYDGFLKLRKPT